MNGGKLLLGLGIAGAAGYLIYKLVGKANEADIMLNNLEFSVAPSKPSFSGISTINIPVNVEIFNPSKLEVSFEKPLVYIKYVMDNGQVATIAHSTPSSDKVTIKAMGVSSINDIVLPINILSNLSVFSEIGKKLFGGMSDQAGLVAKFQSISGNLTALLPLLQVQIITRIGDLAIDKTFALG